MFKKLTENIYYTEPHEDTDRPVMGYIRGKRLSLMAECGNSEKTVEKFNDALKEMGFKKADLAVATHYHWDSFREAASGLILRHRERTG